MKKVATLSVICLSVTLFGCASTGTDAATSATNIGMSIFKSAVDNKCRSELNDNAIYKTASIFMSTEQKSRLEDRVCGCVSEKAPENVTLAEIGQAVIDPAARPRIVGTAVAKTLNACVSEFLQNT